MPQHMRQTPPSWNDPDATQRIPVVRPGAQRAGWAPVPAGQTPERRRAIWKGVAICAGILCLVVTIASLVAGNDSTSSSSSASASDQYSVLGCPLLTAGVADSGCTSRQAIVRACDIPLLDVSWQVTSGSLDTGNGIVWFGAGPGDKKAAMVASATGDPDNGAVIMCPGAETGWPLRTGMWTTLKLPGDPSLLPTWLR